MTFTRIGIGPRMDRAVVHGDTVYLAGVVAQDTPGAPIADRIRVVLLPERRPPRPGRDRQVQVAVG